MVDATHARKARNELIGIVARTGHRVSVPASLTESAVLACKCCGKRIVVRFDVPCGYLVTGEGAGNGCQYSKGF